jgi:predicted metal-dependent enzyme (double-stranded beta helix superfamily)
MTSTLRTTASRSTSPLLSRLGRGDDLAHHAHPSAVARALAEHRDLWAHQVRFDPTAPFEVTVYDDGRHEAVLGAWLPGQLSRAHEHLGRPGAVLVLQGTIEETTWHVVTDGPEPGRRHAQRRTIEVGEVRSHGAVHVHALGNTGVDPALAIHVRSRA